MTARLTPTGTIDDNDLTAPLPSREYRSAWVLNGTVIEIDRTICEKIIAGKIDEVMLARIDQGIKWAENPGSPQNQIALTTRIEAFFLRYLEKRTMGFTSPHHGKVFTRSGSFDISSVFADELALFAGMWGDEISFQRHQLIGGLAPLTVQELIDFDTDAIDWSIDWSADPETANRGWSNDLCLGNP